MIQAIIVKNPKWEPYDKVRDEFAKTTEKDAVLVVRGRCKQKNRAARNDFKKLPAKTADEHAANLRKEGKSAEEIKKALAAFKPVAALILAFLLISGIGAQAQQSITGKLPTTVFAGFTTNWTAGNGVIGWNRNDIAVFQLTTLGTNTVSTGDLTVIFDTSDNGTDWLTNRYTATTTCTGTNAATSITLITNTVGGRWLRVGGYKSTNTSTNAVTIPRFTIGI
jgi:hypothetical protein